MTTGPDPPRQESAVLVPVFRDAGGDMKLVIVRRTEGGLHGGQLAFPGGKRDPGDRSPVETALRETREEIGLDEAAVEILAELPIVDTMTTRFRLFPFLGRIERPGLWKPDTREIAEILEVGVADLARAETHGEETRSFPGLPAPLRIGFFRVGPWKLWGATYRILHPLLPRLTSGEWKI